MSIIDSSNTKEHSYPVYGRQFKSYRWYKPIIAAIVFAIVYLLMFLGLFLAAGIVYGVATNTLDPLDALLQSMNTSYDEMSVTDNLQNIMGLGSLALFIPALGLTSLIVRDRPFSSYSSARGGWSSKVFWRVFPIAFLCNGVPIIVQELVFEHALDDFKMGFTLVSFIILTILGPLQCMGEEYVFRGLFMQTLGSWVRIPVLAVVLQSLIFAAGHPYNFTGQVGIFISGLAFGLSAWITRGLEASSALHIANNMTIFYMMGLNLATVGTEQGMDTVYMDFGIGAAYVLILFWLSRKTKWFDKVRKDDLAKANAKYEAKMARKAAKKAAKLAKKGIKAAGSTAADAAGRAVEVIADDNNAAVTGSGAEYPQMPAADIDGDPVVFDYTRKGRSSRSGETGGKHFRN